MKNHFLSLVGILFCSSCTVSESMIGQNSFLTHVNRKQKQKVIVLQKKLEQAERSLERELSEVENLRSLLCDAQLDSIELELEKLESRWQLDPQSLANSLQSNGEHLFFSERELLYQILQANLSPYRAQNLLDRLLQLITQINDLLVPAQAYPLKRT